jgi:hypothetical protein
VFFFILSLVLSVILCGALLAGLLHSLQINRERKNHRPISYLSPVLLTVVFISLVVFLGVPRFLDLVSMIQGSYVISEIRVEKVNLGWSTLSDGQKCYIYDRWQFKLEASHTYRITCTPQSHFIVDVTEIAESIKDAE